MELDILFGGYEIWTSPQKLYEGCDLGAIAGDAIRELFLQISYYILHWFALRVRGQAVCKGMRDLMSLDHEGHNVTKRQAFFMKFTKLA